MAVVVLEHPVGGEALAARSLAQMELAHDRTAEFVVVMENTVATRRAPRKVWLQYSTNAAKLALVHWICPSSEPACQPIALCVTCYGRELTAKRGQAAALGQCWAERVCRGEHRQREAWPTGEPKALTIARRLVSALATDPRLLEELARACDAGAAAWWARRPDGYR